jgi:hypothetical protein
MYAYLYIEVTRRRMLIEEVLDGHRMKQEGAFIWDDSYYRETHKKRIEISSYYTLQLSQG